MPALRYTEVARGGCRHPGPTKESVNANIPSTPESIPLHRAWCVELDPTAKQRAMLGRHAGVARFAFNFGLRRCAEERAVGRKRPTAFTLQKELVARKHAAVDDDGLPWLAESSKGAPDNRRDNLRLVTRDENAQNVAHTGRGALRGVYYEERSGLSIRTLPWYAAVQVDGIRYKSRWFSTKEEAIEAAKQLRAEHCTHAVETRHQ
jgi:hypothetical protein